jgi:hypothetical protein
MMPQWNHVGTYYANRLENRGVDKNLQDTSANEKVPFYGKNVVQVLLFSLLPHATKVKEGGARI